MDGQACRRAALSVAQSSVIMTLGPAEAPLPKKAFSGKIDLSMSNPLDRVSSHSSDDKITPSGIPDAQCAVDKIDSAVLKRSRDDVQSQNVISPTWFTVSCTRAIRGVHRLSMNGISLMSFAFFCFWWLDFIFLIIVVITQI